MGLTVKQVAEVIAEVFCTCGYGFEKELRDAPENEEHCRRCHHAWTPRSNKKPKACASCKSLNYDLPAGKLKRGPKFKTK